MTPDEFAEAMKEIQVKEAGSPEVIHSEMDDLMVKQLRQCGYNRGMDIFEEQTKWYA